VSASTLAKLTDRPAVLWAQVDADGNPIFTGQVRLVVPPALQVTAMNIMNATEIRVAPGSATTDQAVATNWVGNQVAEVVVNPWLPIVDTSAQEHHLVPVRRPGCRPPGDGDGVPAWPRDPGAVHEGPQRDPRRRRVVGAEDGSFETDGVDYKVRHVFGGALMEPKALSDESGAAPPAKPEDEPAANATTEAWAEYARTRKGASPDDLLDTDGQPLGRNALREKYGTPSQ
jgi:hypothetical protein